MGHCYWLVSPGRRVDLIVVDRSEGPGLSHLHVKVVFVRVPYLLEVFMVFLVLILDGLQVFLVGRQFTVEAVLIPLPITFQGSVHGSHCTVEPSTPHGPE